MSKPAGPRADPREHSVQQPDREALARALDQATESVLITDLDGVITYVNPAFERVSGYAREEVLGQNARLLSSGVQPRSFYEAMWAALTSGVPWVADFVNRHKDGSDFTEEAVITPLRDASGAITSYLAVTRDVTVARAVMERANELAHERGLIADTLRRLEAGISLELTARSICAQVASLTGLISASIFVFDLEGRAVPIGFVVAGQPDPPLLRLPSERSQLLFERASKGPWIEPWTARPEHPYDALLSGLGVHLAAYAPVRYDARLIGFIVIDATESVGEAAMTDVLPALVEFADITSALIGRAAAERSRITQRRDAILAIIAAGAFHPVFQPIVDVGRDVIVGREALTRFDDGVPPDRRFAAAAALGLDGELELATLRASLAAAEALPEGEWLNLNVSPGLILAGDALRSLVEGTTRHLVLEVTEHSPVASYPLLLEAMTRLGPNVEFAVDDAGAGFASLRHILELRPAFVKLDRWLIADLETDSARQAMIVGLRHFARATGCQLIAEGIETEDELAILQALNIRLGQGYLLGRPLPVAKSLPVAG